MILALAAACTACTQYISGTPTAAPPDTSSGTAPSTNAQTYGAPRVTNPLDASTYFDRPCSVLTDDQRASLGISKPGRPGTDSDIGHNAGPACSWANEARTTEAAFLTANKNGLSDTYRGHQQGYFEFWQPTTVDNYPAVFNDSFDQRDMGACGLTVGISDTLTLAVNVVGSDTDPCEQTRRATSMVIDTVKAGG